MRELGEAFSGRVNLVTVDVLASPEAASILGVRGTPTLIGVAQGAEVFRHTGSRTREQLAVMFEALDKGESFSARRTGEVSLAIGAGSILSVAGVVAGPAWGLVTIGMTVLGFGLMRALRAHDA